MYSHSYRKMTSRSDCPTVASVLTDTLTYMLTFFLTSYLLVTSDLTYTVFIPFDFLFFYSHDTVSDICFDILSGIISLAVRQAPASPRELASLR
jgi:hypothetical protein